MTATTYICSYFEVGKTNLLIAPKKCHHKIAFNTIFFHRNFFAFVNS